MHSNILVTGAKGFIGKNLCASLVNIPGISVIEFDTNNSLDELNYENIDFIYHLAGVNRPVNDNEYYSGNCTFTKNLVAKIIEKNLSIPIVLASSIQAELDNLYGKSKLAAEETILEYNKKTGAEIAIFRFPNVFGKWSKPNYNTVVATFCYNLIHHIPLQISDPDTLLNLVYIDDVIENLISMLKTDENDNVLYYKDINNIYKITLGDLVNILNSFTLIRTGGIFPDLSNPLIKNLLATYQSFLDSNEFCYDAKMYHDDRGWLFEMLKSNQLGQIFVSKTKPGITRGNHWHHSKIEKFVVVQGKAIIRLRNIFDTELITFEVNGDAVQIVDIPPGFTHSIENIGNNDVLTLFWASEIFNKEKPDTYFLEVK